MANAFKRLLLKFKVWELRKPGITYGEEISNFGWGRLLAVFAMYLIETGFPFGQQAGMPVLHAGKQAPNQRFVGVEAVFHSPHLGRKAGIAVAGVFHQPMYGCIERGVNFEHLDQARIANSYHVPALIGRHIGRKGGRQAGGNRIPQLHRFFV